MPKVSTVFISALFLIFSMGFINTGDWYLYESKDFSIEFPKKPAINTQTVNSAIGDLKMDICIYDASKDKDDNLVYGLITTEYPDSLINSGKVEELPTFFRNAIDGAVKNVNGKLLSEKSIEINGFPGREFRIDYNNGLAVIKMRGYLIYNKMIFLQTITETSKENNADALIFFNSFKLK